MVKELDIVDEKKTKKLVKLIQWARISCLLIATLCMGVWAIGGALSNVIIGGLFYYVSLTAFIQERYLITKGMIRGWW